MSEFIAALKEAISDSTANVPLKWLYDDIGAAAFAAQLKDPTYYIPAVESGLLGSAIAAATEGLTAIVLIDLGPGDGLKTAQVAASLPAADQCILIDVAPSALEAADGAVGAVRPDMAIKRLRKDFDLLTPDDVTSPPRATVALLLGNTVGNLEPGEVGAALRHFRNVLGPSARLVVGTALPTDPQRVLAAYDSQHVVIFAEGLFREAERQGVRIDRASFDFKITYEPANGHLDGGWVARESTSVGIGEEVLDIEAGQRIDIMSSWRHGKGAFSEYAAAAGWLCRSLHCDVDGLMCVHVLEAPVEGGT